MAGSGTGYPLTLRCAKCKVGDFRYIRRGTKLEATGRVKVLKYHRRLARSQGRLMDGFQTAEYRCLDCGHVGWSRHKTMLRLLERHWSVLNARAKSKPTSAARKAQRR